MSIEANATREDVNTSEGDTGSSSHTTVSPKLSSYVWYVVLLLSIVNVFSYMDRMALAVLLPVVQQDLRLNDAQTGLLLGFAFTLVYAVAGIPIGRWADRGIRRNIIALSMMSWSAMTALSGLAQNFVQLLAARLGLGATEAGCVPPAQSILCDYVPLQRRSGVFAIHSFGLMVGMMAGMIIAGYLGDAIGWRWTFVALGTPGALFALVVRLSLREPARGAADAFESLDRVALPTFRETLVHLWRTKTYAALVVAVMVNGFVQYGLTQWWPTYYSRAFGLSLSTIGVGVGLAIGIGSGVGLMLGGILGDRAAGASAGKPLRVAAVAYGLSLPLAIATLLVRNPDVSFVLIGATALCWNMPMGSMVSAIYSVAPPSMRATAGSVAVFFSSGIGFGSGPFVVGLVSQMLEPIYADIALRVAMVVPVVAIPILVFALLSAGRTVEGDLARVTTD